ncbi:repressor of filamentous growth 1 [Podospora aff. communis PSN243]|uniref:Repressor of filamentous growth 1 n=1 Tax=Podospora aff. communis PSN243 TaxID=3040156 RepID=A0AAV9H457_9PEZI|nr:repressor of filamentous growth 1 [Podospora aff. communis PSN243]
MTRKRAASIIADDPGHPRIEDLSLNTPSTAGVVTPTTRDLICLCTPAPKIPRPRNAFILYRQAHQTQVKLQNKNLPNPEISKIIGERWRDEPEEEKSQWKQLAEEEKLRHQRQYPDYRYQPRRGNKGLPPRLTTVTGEDPGRCPKCGGRYIATPRTPLTPFVSPPGSAVKTPTSMGPPPYGRHGSDASDQYIRQNAQTPYRSDSISSRSGRPQWAGPGPSHGPLYDIHEDYEMASPSDAKRRRYNSAGSASSAGPYRPSYQSLPSPPTPFGGHEPRRQLPHRPSINGPPTPSYGAPQSAGPLPGPSAITRSGSNSDIGPGLGSMRPPPRPGSVSYATGAARGSTGGHSEFDESLRLPPLQTHLPNSPTSEASAIGPGIAAYSTALPPGHDYHSQREREREAHRRSVESMIMTIPYINKLQVLERISQPLPPPGTTGWIMSPGAEPSGGPRGPIIAIEGSNARLLQMVAPIIEKALLASGECDVRTWLPPSPSPEHPNPTTEDVPMRNASTTTSRSASVTSLSTPNTTATFTPYLQAMLDWHVRSSDMVRFVTTLPAPQTTIPSSSDPSSSSAAPPPAPRKAPLPVALLPAGFSLTTSDRFACTTPIADSYAPVDHWQWMATLWRGIAGADLTVYARTATEEELKRLQGVELKAPGLMVVRVDEREVTGGPMAEKTERRLGFEVVEWILMRS